MGKHVIGITMGDPSGIGPEIIVKSLGCGAVRNSGIIVFGNTDILNGQAKKSKINVRFRKIVAAEISRLKKNTFLNSFIPCIEPKIILKTKHKNAVNSMNYIRSAVKQALAGKINAIVTAPINKKAIKQAGYDFPGHTEYLARLCNVKRVCMMFVSEKLKVVLVTRHIPLSLVSKNVKTNDIIDAALLSADLLKRGFGVKNPKLAVSSINPHGGEDRIFGEEEEKNIIPAIKILRNKYKINAIGPFSADTLFLEKNLKRFDLFVCMYHDQGLIPFKMHSFKTGVNITLGLQFIRTSCDHGTAHDIAGENSADPSSLIEAIKLAVKTANSPIIPFYKGGKREI